VFDIIYVSPKLKQELHVLRKQLGYETVDDMLKDLGKKITIKTNPSKEDGDQCKK
jgi:hypothetical protein